MGMENKTVGTAPFIVTDEDGNVRGKYTSVADCARDWFASPYEEYKDYAHLNDADRDELEKKLEKWNHRPNGYYSVLNCLRGKQETFSRYRLKAEYIEKSVDK